MKGEKCLYMFNTNLFLLYIFDLWKIESMGLETWIMRLIVDPNIYMRSRKQFLCFNIVKNTNTEKDGLNWLTKKFTWHIKWEVSVGKNRCKRIMPRITIIEKNTNKIRHYDLQYVHALILWRQLMLKRQEKQTFIYW